MVEQVRLTPVDGKLTIELRGVLAEILNIASVKAQGADHSMKNALQIKMVAGAGFEPTTFRL